MGKHQPYKNMNKFMITERALNYILRPVQVRQRNYPHTYKIENLGNDENITVDRPWTFANHMVLDFIGHELYERAYKRVVEKRNTWRNDFSQSLLLNAGKFIDESYSNIPDPLKQYAMKFVEYKNWSDAGKELADSLYVKRFESDHERTVLENKLQNTTKLADELRKEIGKQVIEQIEALNLKINGSMKPYIVGINLSKLVERYDKFFSKRRKEYLLDLIKRTSKVRFTLNYPLTMPVIKQFGSKGDTKIIDTYFGNVMVINDNIFNIKSEKDKIFIKFDTFLGRAYVHNLLTLNTDWFEEDYLKLDGYASAIYRRFFVIRSGNKVKRLSIKDLVDHFDLLNNSGYPKVIRKAFENIKNAGLIHDYEFKTNGVKFSKGHIEVVKSSK